MSETSSQFASGDEKRMQVHFSNKMSKRLRDKAAKADSKRFEGVTADSFGERVFNLLHSLDAEEDDKAVSQLMKEVNEKLVKLVEEAEEVADVDAKLGFDCVAKITDSVIQEISSDEIRRLERDLIRGNLFQSLMPAWLNVLNKQKPSGEERTEVVKKLQGHHFELSKRGCEIFDLVLQEMGEVPNPDAKKAADAFRASSSNDDEEDDEFESGDDEEEEEEDEGSEEGSEGSDDE